MNVAPIIAMLVVQLFTFGLNAARHGETWGRRYNAWRELVFAVCFNLLLWWGGWYAPLFSR